ncbi:hypothetical protein DCS_04507 [Drechmeria coniospora]|uniref:Uncharacterized protein n=1 Tax=Drechmeria coniospora TaxID=98403 RepID=A0A151GK73_DRECN|nr:hypothetical protein DCS_04507 [Drechmeria coniospora]KYK57497.1 hypothetical protein DCS_04507 [Drechmeria coniospora]
MINEQSLAQLTNEGKDDQFVPIKVLSTEDKERFQLERYDFDIKLRRYEIRKKACSQLLHWMEETISPDLLTNLNDIVEISKIVSKVRQRLGIIPMLRQEQIRTNYFNVMHNSSHLSGLDWYQLWEAAYIDAVAFNIPEIDGTFGITQFLNSAMSFNITWAQVQKDRFIRLQVAGQEIETSLKQLATEFLASTKSKLDQHKESTTTSSAFNTATDPKTKKTYDCPCGIKKALHTWTPIQCAAFKVAVLGKTAF